MGVTSDKLVSDYFGVRIEVEGGITGLMTTGFRLFVSGTKADEVAFGPFGGEGSLRTKFLAASSERTLELRVKQGMFGTDFKLLIDGHEHPIQRLK